MDSYAQNRERLWLRQEWAGPLPAMGTRAAHPLMAAACLVAPPLISSHDDIEFLAAALSCALEDAS